MSALRTARPRQGLGHFRFPDGAQQESAMLASAPSVSEPGGFPHFQRSGARLSFRDKENLNFWARMISL
jgi:hypothetical protein